MKSSVRRLALALAIAAVAMVMSWAVSPAQMPRSDKARRAESPAVIRITMGERHAQGGVPRGWKFLMPRGDAAEGRKVFVGLECFACHEVKGETFPEASKTARAAGPELTGMGSHHPAEYFAESIVNPNRVIVLGPGYVGSDGLSKMPSYADTMTLTPLADVVA